LSFVYVENEGAALGILKNQRWIFIIVTSILLAIIIWVMATGKIKSRLFYAAALLIVGGGIGNLIDRIYLGYVIDYIQLSFFPPVCNFADYCVTAGTIILVIYILFYSNFVINHNSKPAKPSLKKGDSQQNLGGETNDEKL
ncbi:MAG: signal peptidase II, partial [Oscillospiraceae bacterium]|nr:signal peptidase II [Oscillospiraceae bacterium]